MRAKVLALFIIALCCTAIGATDSHAENSERNGKAAVKADSLKVHSRMSKTSKVVKSLNKGDTVTVLTEVEGSDGAWCGVAEEGHANTIGYVPCQDIERESPLKTSWKKVSASKKGTREAPHDKRSYSDITVLLYSTVW